MEKLTFTKEVTTEYTFKQVADYVTKKQRLAKVHHVHKCFKILSDLIRKHRYDLLGTYGGYRIINNGYGEFKYVEIVGDFSEKKNIPASTVLRKLKEILTK